MYTSASCKSVQVAPDDWSWPWCTTASPLTLFSSSTLSSGWLALGQTTSSCSVSISSVDTASLNLSSSVS